MNEEELQKRIESIPQPIKDWFASDDLSVRVDQIYQHFGFRSNEKRIFADLISRILVRDLEPKYFAGELSLELKLERDRAKAISDETFRLLLAPVKNDFVAANIVIDDFSKFEIPIVKLTNRNEPQSGVLPISSNIGSSLEPKPIEIKSVPDASVTPKPAPIATPKIPVAPIAAQAPAPQKSQPPQPAPVLIFKQAEAKPLNADVSIGKHEMGLNMLNKTPQAPVPTKNTAQVQIGAAPAVSQPQNGPARTEVPQIKVVHYSQFRTPVQPAAGTPNATPQPVPLHALGAMTSMPAPAKQPTKPIFAPTPTTASIPNLVPKPAIPPTPPTAPKPTTPPAPQPKAEQKANPIAPVNRNYIAVNPSATPIQPRPLPRNGRQTS